MSDLLLRQEKAFGVTYKLREKYKMGHRNRYSEGRNNRQMTPHGYPNFNSYVKNLCVLVFRTDREINPVWASLTTFLQVKLHIWGDPSRRHVKLILCVREKFLCPHVLKNGHFVCVSGYGKRNHQFTLIARGLEELRVNLHLKGNSYVIHIMFNIRVKIL